MAGHEIEQSKQTTRWLAGIAVGFLLVVGAALRTPGTGQALDSDTASVSATPASATIGNTLTSSMSEHAVESTPTPRLTVRMGSMLSARSDAIEAGPSIPRTTNGVLASFPAATPYSPAAYTWLDSCEECYAGPGIAVVLVGSPTPSSSYLMTTYLKVPGDIYQISIDPGTSFLQAEYPTTPTVGAIAWDSTRSTSTTPVFWVGSGQGDGKIYQFSVTGGVGSLVYEFTVSFPSDYCGSGTYTNGTITGLAYDPATDTLWANDTQANELLHISLASGSFGSTIGTIALSASRSGAACVQSIAIQHYAGGFPSSLWLADESVGDIVHTDLEGNALQGSFNPGPYYAFGLSFDPWTFSTASPPTCVLWQSGEAGFITAQEAFAVPCSPLPAVGAPAGSATNPPYLTTNWNGDPVSSATGNYSYQHTDIAIAGLGPSPAYTRSYNSDDTRLTRLGPGWTDNYNIRLNVTPGDGSGNVILVGPEGRSDTYTYNSGSGTFSAPPAVYTTLVRNGDGTYTATLADQTTWTFGVSGLLTAITDRYGNVSTLTYNSSLQLTSVSDPSGRGGTTIVNGNEVNKGLTFAYDATTGLLTSVTDWLPSSPREVQFTYDSYGRLSSAIDRNAQTTSYGYTDPTGATALLKTITDAKSHTAITNHYDSSNRVDWQGDAVGMAADPTVVTQFQYPTSTPTGTATTTTTITYPATSFDGSAPQTLDTYNASNQLTSRQFTSVSASSGDNQTLTYTYDTNSDLVTTTDGRGHTTTYCYDTPYNGTPGPAAGNLTRKIQPVPTGTATGTSTPLVTLYEYDSKNNLVETIPPKGVSAPWNVSCSTNLSALITPTNGTDMLYDLNGVTLQSITRHDTDTSGSVIENSITQYEYNDAANKGRVTKSIPPLGNVAGTATPIVGDSTAETSVATPAAGQAYAVQVTAGASGTANQLVVYLDGSNSASPIVVGIYADSSGSPGSLIAQGIITAPQASGWNDVAISEVTLTSGTNYWIAALGPTSGATPKIRAKSTGTAKLSNSTTLASLPATWTSSSTSASGTLSAYAVGPDYSYATTFVYGTPYAAVTPTMTLTPNPPSGMLISATDPLNNETTYTYDAVGRRLTMVDPNGNVSGCSCASSHTWTTSYDAEDRPIQVVAPSPTAGATALTTTYEYDLVGNRSVVIDANNQITTYEYDQRDSLAEVDQSSASWTPISGTATPATTPTPYYKTTYAYDLLGNLITVLRDAGDNTYQSKVAYTYDGLNRIRTESQLASAPTATATATLVSTYSYDQANNRTQLTDPLNQTTVYGYDNLNRLTSLNYTATVVPTPVSYTYDADGNRLSMVDGTGTTTYTYDERDRLLRAAQPSATAVAYHYDRDGNRTKLTYPNGNAVNYVFDKDGHLSSQSDSASRAMTYTYNPDGSLASIANVDGTTGTYAYDHALRLTSIANKLASGSIIDQHSYTLDGVGNRTQVTDILASPGSGIPNSWGLNSNSQLGAVSSNTCSSLSCSESPLVVGTGEANGVSGVVALAGGPSFSVALKSDGTVWSWGANGSGQLGNGTTTASAAPVEVMVASATPLANIVQVAAELTTTLALDSSGNVWAWGANNDGQLGTGTTDSSAHSYATQVSTVNHVTLLAAGQLHALALKNDGSTLWGWGSDSNGQLGDGSSGLNRSSAVTVTGLSGTPLTAIAGGGAHSLAVTSSGSMLAWGADTNGQLGDNTTADKLTPVAVSSLTNVATIAGGGQFSLAAKTDGTVWAWGLNTFGQLGDGTTTTRKTPVQVAGVGGTGNLSTIDQVAAGANQSLALGNDGTVYSWGGNAYGQLGDGTSTSRNHPVVVVGSGGTGQLVGMTALGAGAQASFAVASTHTVVNNYTYDHMYRLLTGGLPGGPTTYTYDPRGNRLSLTNGPTTTNFAYDYADRISQIGTATPTVDADGNLTATGSGTTYTYNVPNQLLSSAVSGTTVASYTYNGDGARASMTTGGTTTNYVYDFGGSLANVLTDGTLTYTYGLGLAYTVDGSGNVQVFHPDGLGSVRALTDGSGNLLQTFQTDEFGNPVLTQGTNTEPFRFTGQQHDAATGLYYLRARYYWPTIGRFMSRDTVGGSTASPLTLNRYAYGLDNPASGTDPSGHCDHPSDCPLEQGGGGGAGIGVGVGSEGPNAVANEASGYYKWLRGLYGEEGDNSESGPADDEQVPMATPGTNLSGAGNGSASGATADRPYPIDDAGVDHPGQAYYTIWDKHGPSALYGKSQWFEGEDLISDVRAAETTRPTYQPNYGTWARVVTADHAVGIPTGSNVPTSTYTVITDANGVLINAFPGEP